MQLVVFGSCCHFERSARPGAPLIISCQPSNPGPGQGEIFVFGSAAGIRFLPSVEMTDVRLGDVHDILTFYHQQGFSAVESKHFMDVP